MSDFPKAVARVSEGFCPLHGVNLRRVSQEWLTAFLERHPTPTAPASADEVAQCGMCDGRVWWIDRIDVTNQEQEAPEILTVLRSVPELDADERRFLYHRGPDKASEGVGP